MTSIYQQALGTDFARLHPQIRRRFGFSSEDGVAAIGRGVMERLWHGKPYTLPFLYLGAWRSIMLPEQGRNIPFTIENYAYRDGLGRETVTRIRTFEARRRRFDAYIIYSQQRGLIVDYLGAHQHPAVDIDLRVDPGGDLRLRSGAQRFYEGPLAFSFPMLFSGYAEVHEWYDDERGRFGIQVNVVNRYRGPLFGYRGWFEVEWSEVSAEQAPARLRPRREEPRE